MTAGKLSSLAIALSTGSLLVVLLSGAPANSDAKTDLAKEGDRWWSHVRVLADDSMEGRNAGSAGHLKAAHFLASEFERAGLRPAGTQGYLQPVQFTVVQIDESQSTLAVLRVGETKATPLQLGPDAMLSVRPGLAEKIEADAVFVGYGLTIPEYKYDDLVGLNLRGKIAVYVAGGPSEIPGALRSHYSSRAERWKILAKAGAIGMISVPNPKSMDIPWDRVNLSRLNPSMELADEKLADTPGQQFGSVINPARADAVFGASGHTFSEVLQFADQGKQLPRFPLNIRIQATEHMRGSHVESQNVVALLPGSDPVLKNEYVVFGAHLDHLGVGAAIRGDKIYNGAMDDGSGIASLIEIAQLSKEENLRPKRSILFVAVTGEEKGMLGSQFFTGNPTVPLRNIVAEINMDMYLPLYPLKSLEVIGLAESTLGDDIRHICEKEGIVVQADKEPQRNLFIRSDQYSFIKHGIPALTFKFGWEPGSSEEKIAKAWLRDRYHAPSDDLDQPVDKPAAAKFNRIMTALGMRVADANTRPQWKPGSFFKRFEQN